MKVNLEFLLKNSKFKAILHNKRSRQLTVVHFCPKTEALPMFKAGLLQTTLLWLLMRSIILRFKIRTIMILMIMTRKNRLTTVQGKTSKLLKKTHYFILTKVRIINIWAKDFYRIEQQQTCEVTRVLAKLFAPHSNL